MPKSIHSKDSLHLVLIALPGLLFLFVFKYIPLAGNVIAFQNYNLFQGILQSEWVGLEHFQRMFAFEDFRKIFVNSLNVCWLIRRIKSIWSVKP